MYKNIKIPAVECLENENYNVYRKLFPAKQHFLKWIAVPKTARIRKQTEKNFKKLTELSNYVTSNQ